MLTGISPPPITSAEPDMLSWILGNIKEKPVDELTINSKSTLVK